MRAFQLGWLGLPLLFVPSDLKACSPLIVGQGFSTSGSLMSHLETLPVRPPTPLADEIKLIRRHTELGAELRVALERAAIAQHALYDADGSVTFRFSGPLYEFLGEDNFNQPYLGVRSEYQWAQLRVVLAKFRRLPGFDAKAATFLAHAEGYAHRISYRGQIMNIGLVALALACSGVPLEESKFYQFTQMATDYLEGTYSDSDWKRIAVRILAD